MSNKKIAWEYWNDQEKELVKKEIPSKDEDYLSYEKEQMSPALVLDQNKFIDTPFGQIDAHSSLKPSDRWECWIGHTNFPINEGFYRFLNESVPGIAILRQMDVYAFAIGIPKLFKPDEVKENILGYINEKSD
jgi:hypothetical protein